MMKVVEINNLYFKYKSQDEYLLKGLNLVVNKGEILAVIGESGCGKSTLLSIICGIIPHIRKGYIEGEVKLLGKEVKKTKIKDIAKKVGIVFQDPDSQIFLPAVEDEIAFGPENLMVPREEIGLRIEDALKAVSMEDYRHENPNNLSGGQKQLIALASILAMKPSILLFDEISSQLDEESKKQVKKIILNLKEKGETVVFVEHDLKTLDIADRVLELKNGVLNELKGW
ncbi:MAG: ABC transporter ATP-binding protein [Tissierellia bacterium]|nr:ABC transporter ATP-binding protein [Tissierellia bacterium]